MPINPTTNIDLTASYHAKPQQQQKEAPQIPSHSTQDQDKTDRESVKPTVNTSGQTIGTIVNTKV